VLDVKMPDLDGFGVLSLLRAEGNPVPVVMCSGSALQKDVDRAYMPAVQRLHRKANDARRLQAPWRTHVVRLLAADRTAAATSNFHVCEGGPAR
jgi:CheY-like chemotaxis protein